MGSGRFGRFGFALLGLLGLPAATMIALAASPGQTQGRLSAAAALPAGALSISDSRPGEALLEGTNLAPGDALQGAVTIGNRGSAPAGLSLAIRNLTELPGPGGSGLSSALRIVIRDVTARSDAVVYRGTLAALGRLSLGRVGKAERRRYSVEAVLPAGAPGSIDDSLQGAGAAFAFEWSLGAADRRPCANRLLGGRRANSIVGTSGGDLLTGYLGGDRIAGGPGRDCLGGGPGADRLQGDAGSDRVRGGGGGDVLAGGRGSDRISGGPGRDLIEARDETVDRIDCGPRHDRAIVDDRDRLRTGSCEQVFRR